MAKKSANPPKISVYFVEEDDIPLYDKLENLRAKRKLSKNRLILEIIREHLDNLENESNLTSQPMTEEEAQRLAECERGMVEMKNEIAEIKKLILSVMPEPDE
ncbi:hypothetical protein [Methanoplanus limicola]|uniref:Uncharacterized protein n=1 Tax=Methanoplanus limicola DSM 2279 TaxID=937775 RepID=H1Z182_9EURY|nr:hypothetical protein [Methanoplanus limicola]EHQ35349.1 hypothetical protein Metlim_1239 [Methanoplanus limicola DSM 2279]